MSLFKQLYMVVRVLIFIVILLLPAPFAVAIDDDFVMVVRLSDGSPHLVSGDPEILNRPICVGSLIKPFLAIAAIRSGISPDKSEFCPKSSINIPSEERCWLVAGHGKVSMEKALSNSCSVYFRSLVREIPRKGILHVFHDYRLVDGEYEIDSFSEEDLIGATDKLKIKPGRLLGAYISAFASRELVEYSSKRGKVIYTGYEKQPVEIATKVILLGMRAAATEGIFSKAVKSSALSKVYGKTGTARISGKYGYWRGLFVGFVPFCQPEYAVIVITDKGAGGDTAAPIGLKTLGIFISNSQK